LWRVFQWLIDTLDFQSKVVSCSDRISGCQKPCAGEPMDRIDIDVV